MLWSRLLKAEFAQLMASRVDSPLEFLQTSFLKSTTTLSRNSAAHIYEAYIERSGRAWVESHIFSLLRNLLETMNLARGYDAVSDLQQSLSEVMAFAIQQLPSQSVQLAIVSEILLTLIVTNSSMELLEVELSKHAVLAFLDALALLLHEFGSSMIEIHEVVRESLFKLYSYPSVAVSLSTSRCLYYLCRGMPSASLRISYRLLLSFDQVKRYASDSDESRKRLHGSGLAVATMVECFRFDPLFLTEELLERLWGLSFQLLQESIQSLPDPSGTASSTPRRLLLLKIGWTLIANLITLNSSLVAPYQGPSSEVVARCLPDHQGTLADDRRGMDLRPCLTGSRACRASICISSGQLPSGRSASQLTSLSLQFMNDTLITLNQATHVRRPFDQLLDRLYQLTEVLPWSPSNGSSLLPVVRLSMDRFANALTAQPTTLLERTSELLAVEDDMLDRLNEYDSSDSNYGTRDRLDCLPGLFGPLPFVASPTVIMMHQKPTPRGMVDASIRLFARAFPLQSVKVQTHLLEYLIGQLRQVKLIRKSLLQANVYASILAALRCAIDRSILISREVVLLIQDALQGAMMLSEVRLRRAAAEILGCLARVCEGFDVGLVKTLLDQLSSERETVPRVGLMLALAAIHREVGALAAPMHLRRVIASYQTFGADLNTVVQLWALHALRIVVDAIGLGFAGYVSSSVALVARVLLTASVPAFGVSSIRQASGRLLCSLLATLGPELRASERIAELGFYLLEYLAAHPDPLVVDESFRCLQQFLMLAPSYVPNLPRLIDARLLPQLLRSPYLLQKKTLLECLAQTAHQDAALLFRSVADLPFRLFAVLDREKDSEELAQALRELVLMLVGRSSSDAVPRGWRDFVVPCSRPPQSRLSRIRSLRIGGYRDPAGMTTEVNC